jgi:hypothetical protein
VLTPLSRLPQSQERLRHYNDEYFLPFHLGSAIHLLSSQPSTKSPLLCGTMSAVATVDSAYVLTAASYAIILTRILLRRLKHEKLLLDDYLMLLSIVFYALNTASCPITVCNASIFGGLVNLTLKQNYYGTSLTVRNPKSLTPEQLEQGKALF